MDALCILINNTQIMILAVTVLFLSGPRPTLSVFRVFWKLFDNVMRLYEILKVR